MAKWIELQDGTTQILNKIKKAIGQVHGDREYTRVYSYEFYEEGVKKLSEDKKKMTLHYCTNIYHSGVNDTSDVIEFLEELAQFFYGRRDKL